MNYTEAYCAHENNKNTQETTSRKCLIFVYVYVNHEQKKFELLLTKITNTEYGPILFNLR